MYAMPKSHIAPSNLALHAVKYLEEYHLKVQQTESLRELYRSYYNHHTPVFSGKRVFVVVDIPLLDNNSRSDGLSEADAEVVRR